MADTSFSLSTFTGIPTDSVKLAALKAIISNETTFMIADAFSVYKADGTVRGAIAPNQGTIRGHNTQLTKPSS